MGIGGFGYFLDGEDAGEQEMLRKEVQIKIRDRVTWAHGEGSRPSPPTKTPSTLLPKAVNPSYPKPESLWACDGDSGQGRKGP